MCYFCNCGKWGRQGKGSSAMIKNTEDTEWAVGWRGGLFEMRNGDVVRFRVCQREQECKKLELTECDVG